jgi:WD40 repeat protein
LLASGGDDKSFYLLHGLGTKQPQGFELNHERQQFIRTENHSHDDYVRGLEWFKGPSKETLLASASWDKTLCSWEVDPQITSV